MSPTDPPNETPTTHTRVYAALLHRVAGGEAAARNELLSHVSDRLRWLVRRQLRAFPQVRRWEETSDVLQQVLIRLCRALEHVKLDAPRELFALASRLIRRELIDLKRHHYGPLGGGAHHATAVPAADRGDGSAHLVPDAGSDTLNPSVLAEWGEFHERVEAMDSELREVVDLIWYQGLEQGEAADILGVSAKTVSRRWREARLELGRWLTGQGPESSGRAPDG